MQDCLLCLVFSAELQDDLVRVILNFMRVWFTLPIRVILNFCCELADYVILI